MHLRRSGIGALILFALVFAAAAGGSRSTGKTAVWKKGAAAVATPSLGVEPWAAPTATLERLGRSDYEARAPSRGAAGLAHRLGLERSGAFVRVVIEARTGTREHVQGLVGATGGAVELTYGPLVQALVPTSALPGLVRDGSVARVRAPNRFVPAAVPGEGVAATNTPAWQRHGLTGKGVKIAVFDFGFGGLAERQAAGEIPASAVVADFCGGKAAGPKTHGTAVAEIVSELAPAAKLYLVCVDTDVSLGAALSFARSNGVRVINMSGGWYNSWRGDGKGPAGTPDAVVAAARASGILWVNSAGNEALSHWLGSFTSADGDRWHDFASGDEVNTVEVPPGNSVCGFLRWDGWPTPSDDFDLAFYDAKVGIVDVSDGDQLANNLPPTEALCMTNVSGEWRSAGFAIYRYAGSGTPSFDLFVRGEPYALTTQYASAARSVTDPGASPNVVTAGAVCWQAGAVEPFSSQGPTIDGRLKPDVTAPDGVSTATFGPASGCGTSGFLGTSAAAPHVAGVAALFRQRFPTTAVAKLQATLLKETVDAGAAGPDNVYGAGRLGLRELPQAALTALAAKAAPGTKTSLRFRVRLAQWDIRDHVHVFRGSRQIATFTLPFGPVRDGTVRSAAWRAPSSASAGARYRFCAEGWDRAGHASRRSCARIVFAR